MSEAAVRGSGSDEELMREYFDRDFYLAHYPEVESVARDPFDHFLISGWREGRNPSARFDTGFYLRSNEDVARAEVNPLWHFVKYGVAEGRRALPDALESHIREAMGRYFDSSYYLSANPDVAAAGVDPLVHYHFNGWKEGRNPSSSFDTRYYLLVNEDVASAGMNPLLHYAYAGAAEGRFPKRPLDSERRVLEGLETPSARARHWSSIADTSEPLSLSEFMSKLREEPAGSVVVSISHDDYFTSVGGVQNVIRDELLAFEREGWSYLHVSPAAPLPMLAPSAEPNLICVRVRVGHEFIGVVTTSTLAAALSTLRRNGSTIAVIIHHLMGYAPEAAATLIDAAGDSRPTLWLHDYFAHCPNYTLMRNDLAFCGAPPAESTACGICIYGRERPGHLKRMKLFIEKYEPIAIAPSQRALDVWMQNGAIPLREPQVVPIARLLLASSAPRPNPSDRKLRVAHLGQRIRHKGWPTFEVLAAKFSASNRYEFYQLGIDRGDVLPGCIVHVPVEVTEASPDAMIDALRQHQIDIVVNWAMWPETFNFTVHETLASGAFVVARRDAGNVWPAVIQNAPSRGIAVESEVELHSVFESQALEELVASAPARSGALIRGAGAADVVLRQHGGRASESRA